MRSYEIFSALDLTEQTSKTGARDPKKLGLVLALGHRTAGPQAVRWCKAANNSVCFFRRETLATVFFLYIPGVFLFVLE